MFVSESFLIGSAADHRSVIIEKTPDTLDVYDPHTDNIQCANHYQSNLLKNQELNREQMAVSASVYRYHRTQELLQRNYPLTPQKAAAVLRDYKGLNDEDIGVGNEKAVNQFVAHHSIIFMPDSLRMWVSTSPWQMGAYASYDLRKIFAMKGLPADREIADTELNIAPDSFLNTPVYARFLQFRQAKMNWLDHLKTDVNQFIPNNPSYYDAYRFTGDYYLQQKDYAKAIAAYKTALGKVIATEGERKAIEEKIIKAEQQARKKAAGGK